MRERGEGHAIAIHAAIILAGFGGAVAGLVVDRNRLGWDVIEGDGEVIGERVAQRAGSVSAA